MAGGDHQKKKWKGKEAHEEPPPGDGTGKSKKYNEAISLVRKILIFPILNGGHASGCQQRLTLVYPEAFSSPVDL